MTIGSRIRAWLKTPEHLAFVVLLGIHLIPVWSVTYFPSQDGPTHIENASVLRHYHDPARPIFRDYYELNERPVPNWASHLVLAALMFIVSPVVAEKILLTGYVLGFALALRYAVGAIRPRARWASVLGFPFIFNYLIHMGMYNFCCSMAVYFLVVGYWIKHQKHMRWPHGVALLLMSVLAYFTHAFGFAMAGLTVGIVALWYTGADLVQRRGLPEIWRRFRCRIVVPLLGLSPAIAGAIVYFYPILSRKFGVLIGKRREASELLESLVELHSLISYDPAVERMFSTAVAALFGLITLYVLGRKIVKRGWTVHDGFFLVPVVIVVLYFSLPPGVLGQGLVKERLNLYPCFALLLWFAPAVSGRLARLVIWAAAAALSVGLVIVFTRQYHRLNIYLEDYLSCRHRIEAGSTLLPISYSHNGHTEDGARLSEKVMPFWHASGHIAATRELVEFTNYEARTVNFPTTWRRRFNPYTKIGNGKSLEWQPPRVRFLDYHLRTGGRVDYVLLWNAQHNPTNGDSLAIYRQLRAGYELIHATQLTQLFRRRNLAAYRQEAAAVRTQRRQ